MQAKKRALSRNWPGQHLDLDLGYSASRTIRKEFSLVSATQPMVFYSGSLGELMPFL